MIAVATESPITAIPAPDTIRARLSEISAESRVLHQLLRVAERKEREERRLEESRGREST